MAHGNDIYYPLWLRGWHWLNALLFLLLIATGITMQYASARNPFIPFSTAITVHNAAGVTLTLSYLIFFLGNLVSGNYRQYMPRLKGLAGRLVKQGRYYLFGIFKGEDHPYEVNSENKFNPLQQVTYAKIMYFLMPLIIISGWGLLFPESIPEEILGASGLFLTAVFHTGIGFFLSIFMIGHIYLATTGTTVTANFRAMINGKHS